MDRRLPACLLVASLLVCGCAEEEPLLTLGAQCDLTSECEAPLVCRIGRCRRECATVRDCSIGALCAPDNEGLGACTLPEEETCVLDSDCPSPLVCAPSGCTNECATDADCTAGALCDPDTGRCIDPVESSCVLDSDCAPPLVCAPDGRCRDECRSSRDCREGTLCTGGRCVRPAVDAGTPDAGPPPVDGGFDAGAEMDAGAPTDAGWDPSWIWRDAGWDAGEPDASLPACSATLPCPGAPDAVVECLSDQCEITGCAGTFGDCDGLGANGCETNTDTHRDHCGACGSPCPAGQACLGGTCAAATVVDVAVSQQTSCAAWSTGEVTCWGNNGYGQLGAGDAAPKRTVPVAVASLGDVTAIEAGVLSFCALRSDATVWCWGRNTRGVLGDGTTMNRNVPVQVGGLTDATALSVGGTTACALRADATAVCWGANNVGQVGDGTITDRSTPVAVSGLSGIVTIDAGVTSCAVLDDGTLRCWGWNELAQIDDTAALRYTTPVAVTSFASLGLTPASVRADRYVLVRGTDGRVACRGENGARLWQCGAGTADELLTTPAVLPGLAGVDDLDGECAVTAGGEVWCWGTDNRYGSFGLGTFEWGHATAVRSTTAPAAAQVANHETTCVRTTAGGVYCAGRNADGEVGDGTTTDRSRFVKVEGTP